MAEKKKLLIVTEPLNVGGYDIVATNLQMNLNPEKYDCTYCVRGTAPGLLDEQVLQSGAHIIRQPDSECGYLKSYFYYKRLFKREHFDIVHAHLMFFSGIVMRAAFRCGVPKRVAHSHMTDPCFENRSALKKAVAKLYSLVMKRWLRKYATDLIACGPEAGVYLYGKKTFAQRGVLLNNGTYTQRFAYDEAARSRIRRELNIESQLVMGHVGRLNYVKNHKFLLDVFYAFQKQHPNSLLLIVGDGEERARIEQKAKQLKIEDKVRMTGIRRDVERLLLAMDVFVFPSLHEGLPMTLVEAQAAKLPCLVADTVSRSAKLTDSVKYLSLNDSAARWAEAAYALTLPDRNATDVSFLKQTYDIQSVAKQLEAIYEA